MSDQDDRYVWARFLNGYKKMRKVLPDDVVVWARVYQFKPVVSIDCCECGEHVKGGSGATVLGTEYFVKSGSGSGIDGSTFKLVCADCAGGLLTALEIHEA